MKICPKAASFSWVALYAVLGVSTATQAHAFFRGYDERPPPNGANGLTLNGLTLNGLTLNGLTLNGLTLNGVSANGQASQEIKLQGIVLPKGERIGLR